MTIDEALDKFQEILNNPKATLDDLSEMVNQLSVIDKVAPDNAITHLYTKVGNNKGFINKSQPVEKVKRELGFFA